MEQFFVDKSVSFSKVRRLASLLESAYFAIDDSLVEGWLLSHGFDDEGQRDAIGTAQLCSLRVRAHILAHSCKMLEEELTNLCE